MTEVSDTKPGKPGWFWLRWVPRGFLAAATLTPVFYVIFYQVIFYYVIVKELGPQYWDFDEIGLSIFLLAIFLIDWWAPIIGGILAIVIVPFIVIAYELMTVGSGFPTDIEVYLFILSSLLVIGGVLSIIYGIRRWKWRRGEREQA